MCGAAEGWRLASGLFVHWSAAHAIANGIAVGTLGLLVARREGPGVLAWISAVAWGAQVLALGCGSGAVEFRGASGFAYALGAFVLVRSFARNPWESALVGIASLAYAAALGLGAIASPWLPPDVTVDLPVHLAGAIAGALAAATTRPATGSSPAAGLRRASGSAPER